MVHGFLKLELLVGGAITGQQLGGKFCSGIVVAQRRLLHQQRQQGGDLFLSLYGVEACSSGLNFNTY